MSAFQENALMSFVGIISIAIALTRNPRYMVLSGMSYWLIAPLMFLHGYTRGGRRRRLEQNNAHGAESPLNVPAG